MSQVSYNIVSLIGVLLLFAFYRRPRVILWRMEQPVAWCLFVLALTGLCFTWWARLHLGRLWSRWVVRKEHHRIVQSGPYALVRHPIYTGVSLALIATAVMFGTLFACLGAALIVLSFYMKARLEERFLRDELGAEAYDEYARRVPMLVPFVRR
jgi:protein-S-isoprenylcysteine O-methyltransferase Ste14